MAEKLNIYRIYTSCEIFLISSMNVENLNIIIRQVEDEICIEFVDNSNSKVKTKMVEEGDKDSFVKELTARLMTLSGRIDKKTDWTNRIELFFPLPRGRNDAFLN